MAEPQIRTKSYAVYKKTAAMRLTFIPARIFERDGNKQIADPFVYLEVAPVREFTKEVKSYKWEENKIGVKLGMSDLQEIAYALSRGTSCKLFHEWDGTTKTIELARAEDTSRSPYFLTVNQKTPDGQMSKVGIPISASEAYAISKLTDYAIPKILNW